MGFLQSSSSKLEEATVSKRPNAWTPLRTSLKVNQRWEPINYAAAAMRPPAYECILRKATLSFSCHIEHSWMHWNPRECVCHQWHPRTSQRKHGTDENDRDVSWYVACEHGVGKTPLLHCQEWQLPCESSMGESDKRLMYECRPSYREVDCFIGALELLTNMVYQTSGGAWM